jgi:hypothetical protein
MKNNKIETRIGKIIGRYFLIGKTIMMKIMRKTMSIKSLGFAAIFIVFIVFLKQY